ncbi:MAG: hemagglutinin repeat-containing protein, partial [Desulfobulbus sp.]|nr:hemagglutinin repeat-containing protein [Desulfobulbus sp.]
MNLHCTRHLAGQSFPLHAYNLCSADIDDDGIAADTIRLETAGDLVTGGTIAGRQIVSLAADNLTNLRGRIAGQDVEVLAQNDLTLRGGAIEAQNSLIAAAGRDLTIESATSAQHSQLQGTATFVDTTVIDRVAGLYVTGDNAILLAAAGRDFNLNAAAVYNGGDGGVTVLQAGRDLTLGTVTETLDSYAHTQTSWRKENATTQVGSLVQAQGNILLLAGNDLTARGATVASQEGALAALAGGDITLSTATNTYQSDAWRKIKKSDGWSSSKQEYRDKVNETTHTGSTFSGDT